MRFLTTTIRYEKCGVRGSRGGADPASKLKKKRFLQNEPRRGKPLIHYL
jgi:hypothetical protein